MEYLKYSLPEVDSAFTVLSLSAFALSCFNSDSEALLSLAENVLNISTRDVLCNFWCRRVDNLGSNWPSDKHA